MIQNRIVTVFGAYGHTGRFVVAELRKRGFTPILSGRDAAKLKEAGNVHPGSEVRVASVDDPASLDRALSGAMTVINCAGPFIDTAGPVIDAALRASIHYLDVAAEQAAVLTVFERFASAARDAGHESEIFAYFGVEVALSDAHAGSWIQVHAAHFATVGDHRDLIRLDRPV